MQQNGTTRDVKNETNTRQRPLQKSMLLPDTYNYHHSPPPRIAPFQFNTYLTKKAPSSPADPNTTPPASPSPPFVFTSPTLNYHSLNPTPKNQEPRTPTPLQTESKPLMAKTLLSAVKGQVRSEKNPEQLSRSEHKAERIPAPAEFKPSAAHTEQIINEIMHVLRDKYLPAVLSKLKKEIYDDIYNVRAEVQTLKEEIKSQLRKQEQTRNIQIVPPANQQQNKYRGERDEDVAELQTHCYLLEGKCSQLQAKMGENMLKMMGEFQKINSQLAESRHTGMKNSPVRSSLPSIMLEYKQMFTVKRGNPFLRGKDDEEILLSTCVYCIDRLGFLMDGENRYLIDNQGLQIRLEEKHLRLLESHKILQK